MTPTDFARDPIQSMFVRLVAIERLLLMADAARMKLSVPDRRLFAELGTALTQLRALMDQLRPLLDGVPE